MKNTRKKGRLHSMWDISWTILAVIVAVFVGWEFAGVPEYLFGGPVAGIVILAAAIVGLLVGFVGTVEVNKLVARIANRPDLKLTF